jgi:hypothetical protein
MRQLGTCSTAKELKDSKHKVGEVVEKDKEGCIYQRQVSRKHKALATARCNKRKGKVSLV